MFKNNHIEAFKKGGKVKKIKQKQKQKQSQQTKINIRIGDVSKKKSKSRRRSERNRTGADTKIQFVPQYIQSGPMITSDTVRSSLQPVNLSEALNKRLGEFEKKINEGIPLQNVDELKSLINQGIETMKRPTDRRPPPFMRPDSMSSASSDSGDMYYYTLPDDEDYSTSWRDFSPINLSEIKFPPVGVPRNEGPEEVSSRVWETLFPQGPPRQEFEDDMKYPMDDELEYVPDYGLRHPLGDMGMQDLPLYENLPINLPPIEEEPEEEVNYPLVELVQRENPNFIKANEPQRETFSTGIKVKKDKDFLNTGYTFKGKDIYLSERGNPYMFTQTGEFKPANNAVSDPEARIIKQFLKSKGITIESY